MSSSTSTSLCAAWGRQNHFVLSWRRRSDRLYHLANELCPRLGYGLVLRKRHIRQQGGVADDACLGVAVDIGLPLPTGRVRVTCANILGLQALEFLLGAELIGLDKMRYAPLVYQ